MLIEACRFQIERDGYSGRLEFVIFFKRKLLVVGDWVMVVQAPGDGDASPGPI